MIDYEVIIAGGGPVGVALAIELGLKNIRTLILEKHAKPLRAPRAQSLSARSMEFFLRWGADKMLMDNLLLPLELPQTGIWCSTLCGESYFEGAWGDNKLAPNTSPKEGVRVPLWITEEILQQRVAQFDCVHFLKEKEVTDLELKDDKILIKALDKKNHDTQIFQSKFLACCDGASGPTKRKLNNNFNALSEKTRMLATLFISQDLMEKKTVPDGIMYFILENAAMAFVGPIDLKEGLWHAQIVWPDANLTPDEVIVSQLIDTLVGTPIQKEIVDFYFWDMQVQIADFFSLEDRVFWLGDSAHAFAPTGGLGLNTGLGDAQNLGWKLASVIKENAPTQLLKSYEEERHPVWINNLHFAKQNAEEFIQLKKQFDPHQDPQGFAQAYANLGDRFLSSSGLTLGYAYQDSPLTQPLVSQKKDCDFFQYTPKTEPGYFLPHVNIHNQTIYQMLSPLNWTLIICSYIQWTEQDKKSFKKLFALEHLNILELAPETYAYPYLLIRPDWHIARVGQCMEDISGTVWRHCNAF